MLLATTRQSLCIQQARAVRPVAVWGWICADYRGDGDDAAFIDDEGRHRFLRASKDTRSDQEGTPAVNFECWPSGDGCAHEAPEGSANLANNSGGKARAIGFPGYDSIIGSDNATVGRILKENGYATSWFGKNHNTPSFQYATPGPLDWNMPC